MIKAIIFDVDGTLLDSEKIYMEAWRRGAARCGYEMTDRALMRTRAMSKARAIEIFKEELGQDFPYDRVRAYRVEIAEEILLQRQDLVKPGVRETLDWLREREIPMAVASTTKTDRTREHLRHFGLLEYFDQVVGGDQVENGKPDPAIFLRAAALLGEKPADCLVVGDTPADAGAADGGLPVVLVPDQVPANDHTRAVSLAILDSMAQLRSLVEPLLPPQICYAPLTMADGADFFRLAGDEQVAKTMRFDCPHTRQESDRVLEEYCSGGNRAFGLRFQPEGELWGVFAFKQSSDPETADLSQMQVPEQWGKGLGKRVTAHMVALARKNRWYKALEGYILESNTASRRMAEGNGFREKTRHRFPGMTEDLVVYRLEL